MSFIAEDRVEFRERKDEEFAGLQSVTDFLDQHLLGKRPRFHRHAGELTYYDWESSADAYFE